jgi:hypothetical protein
MNATLPSVGGKALPSLLQTILNNYVTWADLNDKKTRQYGNKELAYVTNNSTGYHLDFSPFSGRWPKFNRRCVRTTLIPGIQMLVCIATDTDDDMASSIIGGLHVCDDVLGVLGNSCTPDDGNFLTPTFSTRLNISRAGATVGYSLRNSTILSLREEWASPLPINVTWFFKSFTSPFATPKLFALTELLGTHHLTSLTPQLIFSLAMDFLFAKDGHLDAFHILRNIMALGIAAASVWQDEVENSGSQALTTYIYTVEIDRASLFVFIILGAVTIGLCMGQLFWSTSRLPPRSSAFPDLDLASRNVGLGLGELDGLSNGETTDYLKKLGPHTYFYVGEGIKIGRNGRLQAVVTVDTSPLAPLRENVSYY